jgi:hypothetical protein
LLLGGEFGSGGVGDKADLADAGFAEFGHDLEDGAIGEALVGVEKDLGGLFDLGVGFEFFDEVLHGKGRAFGAIVETDGLLEVDGEDDIVVFEVECFACFKGGEFDVGFFAREHGGGDHEDHEKDEHDVDEGGDVDIGEGAVAPTSLHRHEKISVWWALRRRRSAWGRSHGAKRRRACCMGRSAFLDIFGADDHADFFDAGLSHGADHLHHTAIREGGIGL